MRSLWSLGSGEDGVVESGWLMVVGFTDCCCALLTLHWSADLETVDYHFRLLLLLDEEKMQITVMSSGSSPFTSGTRDLFLAESRGS